MGPERRGLCLSPMVTQSRLESRIQGSHQRVDSMSRGLCALSHCPLYLAHWGPRVKFVERAGTVRKAHSLGVGPEVDFCPLSGPAPPPWAIASPAEPPFPTVSSQTMW